MYATKFTTRSGTRAATGEKVPFLSDKEKYQDPRDPVMPRHKGKQFLTNPAKEPSGGNVGFFHPLKYPAGVAKYDDKTGYLRTQPIDSRKSGFGTHDAKRRDQFTKHIETERYRELLKAERRIALKTIPVVSDAALHSARSTTAAATVSREADYVLREIPTNGYDRMKAGDTLMDKLHSDLGWKHRRASSARRMGPYKLSSQAVGMELPPAVKPEFGRVAVTKDFYFSGHAENVVK